MLEKHLRELWRTARGAIRLNGVDAAVIVRIVIIEYIPATLVDGRGRSSCGRMRLVSLGSNGMLSRGHRSTGGAGKC